MSNLIRLSDVHRQAVVWLEHGTIPRGMPSILAGHPGLGRACMESRWLLGCRSARWRL